jgi:NAD(P)-dependent dehydrogenase (short-subunit alcohol dehydrogenase family)
MYLKDKVALITGSASGIGRASALKFAGEGCDIVVNDLRLEPAENVAEEVRRLGRKALAVKADISNKSEVDAMAAKAMETLGKIDILMNSAGGVAGVQGGDSDTATEADWDKVLSINLKGAFLVCMAVIPQMKARRSGKIINLSSMGAVNPAVSVLHYHSAKAGILGLTKNLAFELAPYNIHVNAIVPGPVDSPFWDALQPPGPERDAFLATLAKKEVPLERIGTPDDIAGPALFLASPLSDYVTGQIICVAGGQPLLAHEATFLSAAQG